MGSVLMGLFDVTGASPTSSPALLTDKVFLFIWRLFFEFSNV
jgi:hypothetical protein